MSRNPIWPVDIMFQTHSRTSRASHQYHKFPLDMDLPHQCPHFLLNLQSMLLSIEKEREVVQLNLDNIIKNFLAWRKSAKATLSLIDDYREDILIKLRADILFEVTILCKTVWTKLQMATRKLNSKYTDLADIESPQIHQLWSRLQSIYLPTTLQEKYKLETTFSTLTQGPLSAWEYIQLILEKSNELPPIGIPIAKEKIMCVIMNALTNETLKTFIYCLHPSLPMEECFTSIFKYVKNITTDTHAFGINMRTPTALMVEQEDNNPTRPYVIRCYKCHEPRHKGYECPHRYPSGTERIHPAITAQQPRYLMNHSEVIVRHRPTQIGILTITPGILYRHHTIVDIHTVIPEGVSPNTELRELLTRLPTMIHILNDQLAHMPETSAPIMSSPDWITMVINESSLMISAGLTLEIRLTTINGLLHHHIIVLRVTLNGTRLDRTIIIHHTTTELLPLKVAAFQDPEETHMTAAVVIDPLTYIPGCENNRVPIIIDIAHHL